MTKTVPSDFKEGDRVSHSSAGDGTVVYASHVLVRVEYDHAKTRGDYDLLWFRLHGTKLRLINKDSQP